MEIIGVMPDLTIVGTSGHDAMTLTVRAAAAVHRAGATLSPAAQVMVHLATRRIQEVIEPIAPRGR